MDLCAGCRRALPENSCACRRCGLALPQSDVGVCGACLKKAPPVQATRCLYRYEEPVRLLIHDLKFRNNYACARLFGELLAASCADSNPRPQVLIPVPLHPTRYRERGFNQSTEIARIVSRRLGIALALGGCVRTRPTHPQADLAAAERRKNIRGAFRVTGKLRAHHVAIVDDIVTTGATVHELARSLRRAGVGRVDVWAIARA